MLARGVKEDRFLMSVRRGHVLCDALRSMKRISFSPELTLQVCVCVCVCVLPSCCCIIIPYSPVV